MPVQKVKDLRDLTDDELERKLLELKDELWRLRFQLATRQLENPMRIREVRKAFACTKTIIREREIERERGNLPNAAVGAGDVQASRG
jgi:large subunit ribosomal protein L29